MSNLARYGLIAAAVVLLVGAGVVLFRPAPATNVAAPSASPSPSASAEAGASPTLRPGALPAGPTQLIDEEVGGVAALSITIPAGGSGWTSADGAIFKDYGPAGSQDGPIIMLWPGGITGTYVDPCTDHTLKQPDPEGVEDLIAALGNQPGVSAPAPVDVTISGYSGQYVETTVTQDVLKCGNGFDGFWLWDGKHSDRRYVQGTGEVNRIYAVDVDGEIFTFDVRLPAYTTDADVAEVMSMLETLEITPVASPSLSPSP